MTLDSAQEKAPAVAQTAGATAFPTHRCHPSESDNVSVAGNAAQWARRAEHVLLKNGQPNVYAKIVLMALAEHADHATGRNASPSNLLITQETGVANVEAILDTLIAHGLIEPQVNDRTGHSGWRVCMEVPVRTFDRATLKSIKIEDAQSRKDKAAERKRRQRARNVASPIAPAIGLRSGTDQVGEGSVRAHGTSLRTHGTSDAGSTCDDGEVNLSRGVREGFANGSGHADVPVTIGHGHADVPVTSRRPQRDIPGVASGNDAHQPGTGPTKGSSDQPGVPTSSGLSQTAPHQRRGSIQDDDPIKQDQRDVWEQYQRLINNGPGYDSALEIALNCYYDGVYATLADSMQAEGRHPKSIINTVIRRWYEDMTTPAAFQ